MINRKLLIELFRGGMRYPQGKHQVRLSKVFQITVRPDEVVELDEYEGFVAEENHDEKMFHLGRAILDLKKGHVEEEPGTGWERPL